MTNKTTKQAVNQEVTVTEIKTVELKKVIGGMAASWGGGVERGALSIGHQMRN